MDYAQIAQMAAEVGFTHVAPLDPNTLNLKPEVRQMCEANSCGQYGKRWSCPPGCGTLEACIERVSHFNRGILVQTVGELEDELDGEGMIETEHLHKDNFLRLNEQLRKQHADVLALGAGCCTLCKTCTYPEEPCRFPNKQISSMEAYGLVVLDVCKANQLPYYYGKCTISYTGCFLFNE
ncbi:MAG: DUF2284 domain-containing protein [Faecousia sp.]